MASVENVQERTQKHESLIIMRPKENMSVGQWEKTNNFAACMSPSFQFIDGTLAYHFENTSMHVWRFPYP